MTKREEQNAARDRVLLQALQRSQQSYGRFRRWTLNEVALAARAAGAGRSPAQLEASLTRLVDNGDLVMYREAGKRRWSFTP